MSGSPFNYNETGSQYDYGVQDELFLYAFDTGKEKSDLSSNNRIRYLSDGNTFKIVVFALGQDEIQVRVNNLDDRFDENPTTYVFNVQRFAREFYFESNEHLFAQLRPKRVATIMSKINITITEMNLAGSMTLKKLKASNLTQWKTVDLDANSKLESPKDHIFEDLKLNGTGHYYSLEPQRIRVFNIRYVHNNSTDILQAIRNRKNAKAAKKKRTTV